jgi:glycosyltransferase involved in cell wall biosynthesis
MHLTLAKMPRVLRIINRFNLGGPTYNVSYLSKFLSPDYETLLVGGMKDSSEDSSEFIVAKLGLTPTIIPNMRREISPLNDYHAYKKLVAIIKEFKPDIVHTHASKAGTLGRLAAINCNVPIVLHTFHGHVFHSYFGKLKTRFYKAIERYLAKKSTMIVAISEKQKQELTIEHKIAPPNKCAVIPLGFDLSRFEVNQSNKRIQFRTKHNIAKNDIAIGIIGRLVPIKNHILFLKALKYVLDNTSKQVKAFIIGDGELYNDIRLEATRIGIGYNKPNEYHHQKPLYFTSWMRDVDVAYAGIEIVALTSFNEGTPVSLIEALAAGKSVITTNVGGIENIISHNKTGLLIPVNEEALFSQSLLKLVEDDEFRNNIGSVGKHDILKRYSYSRLVEDMKTFYDKLLGN